MLPIIRFKPICLIALLLLAVGALGCGAEVAPTATVGLPEPAPTATAGMPEPTPTAAATATPVADLPGDDAAMTAVSVATPAPTYPQYSTTTPPDSPPPPPHPPSPYPNLDFNLAELLMAIEEGWSRPTLHWAEHTYLYPVRQWVEVRLSDNLGSVIRWLETNDATIEDVSSGEDGSPGDILAVVPVYLLGKLSERDGVDRVVEEVSFFNNFFVRCPPDCGGHINFDLAEMLVGQSQDFFLFSNTDGSFGNLVRVGNIPGDTGEIAIGSCDGPRMHSQFLKNGEYITIAACALGTASVELFYHDNASGEDIWREDERGYVINVVSPVLRDPGFSPPLTWAWAVFQVGQSRTFTLNTTIPNPPGVKVSVNDDHWLNGNLAIGDCPGTPGEGVILGDGDTVTITGCEPGHAGVVLQGGEYRAGYTITVWDD